MQGFAGIQTSPPYAPEIAERECFGVNISKMCDFVLSSALHMITVCPEPDEAGETGTDALWKESNRE